MKQAFRQHLAELTQHFNHCLPRCIQQLTGNGETALAGLDKAVSYVLDNGGKRVRPSLTYMAAEAVAEIDRSLLDNAACAIELVHTYSLVHDDLPAMDDDDLRRGRPSCHIAFDEATAILVGDGLQAMAFSLLARAPQQNANNTLDMLQTLADAAGNSGMVGGQYIDISSEGMELGLEQLQRMHRYKTGALIRAALALGGIAAGADTAQRQALDAYGDHIGLAFQVVDDILDVEGDTATLGKTSGKDEAAAKSTYISLLGVEGARQESQRLRQAAIDSLSGFGARANPLRHMADYIVNRDH